MAGEVHQICQEVDRFHRRGEETADEHAQGDVALDALETTVSV